MLVVNKNFKVREQYSSRYGDNQKDSDFDRVTFFATKIEMENYYYSVVGRNYYTDISENKDGKWVVVDTICHQNLALH